MDIDTFVKLRAFDDAIMDQIGDDITLDDIQTFLSYDTSFWNYLKGKVSRVDSNQNDAKYFYGTYPSYDSNGVLSGLYVIVPIIKNLGTALINVHEYRHAYDLYNHLGQKYVINQLDSEALAKETEEAFSLKYALSKGSKWLDEQTSD